DTLYVANREDWRKWLNENYKTANEVWLVYYRKHAGIPRIPYNHAVEEALCFGWIDSIVKGIDQDRYAQRFTPRNPRSSYSQANKERLRRLIERGKVMPDVLAAIGDVATEEYEFPPDIMAVLRANKRAWENFQRYSGSYQRIRIAFIDAARKRPGEFEKRLKHFTRMTEQDKQYGFGIEEYY
ncbi:MAG: YdeI family protein, partial [Anaerolineae bacterium]